MKAIKFILPGLLVLVLVMAITGWGVERPSRVSSADPNVKIFTDTLDFRGAGSQSVYIPLYWGSQNFDGTVRVHTRMDTVGILNDTAGFFVKHYNCVVAGNYDSTGVYDTAPDTMELELNYDDATGIDWEHEYWYTGYIGTVRNRFGAGNRWLKIDFQRVSANDDTTGLWYYIEWEVQR